MCHRAPFAEGILRRQFQEARGVGVSLCDNVTFVIPVVPFVFLCEVQLFCMNVDCVVEL